MKIKKRVLVFLLALLIISVSYFVYKISSNKIKHVCIENKSCFDVEVADSSEELALGLSNREQIPENQGMLFILPKESVPGFWMKGMKFSLDIIWINKNFEIAGIEKNLQPCEPNKECIAVYSREEIAYVLEIKSGLSESYGFENGDKVSLK